MHAPVLCNVSETFHEPRSRLVHIVLIPRSWEAVGKYTAGSVALLLPALSVLTSMHRQIKQQTNNANTTMSKKKISVIVCREHV